MTEKLIYKKMIEVMKEVGAIGKEQRNTAQNFSFRGIDQFVNALYPALTKAGVFMAPSVISEGHELREVLRSGGRTGVDKHVHLLVKYTFYAEDGSSVEIGPIASEGLDSGDKATNKALSSALKYALIQTFSVPTADMEEADRTSPEIVSTTRYAATKVDTPVKAATPVQEVSPPKRGFRRVGMANGAAKPAASSTSDEDMF